MHKSPWASESAQATATMARHPYAPTATMIIIRTLVRPTVTTARIGLSAESLSAPARGSTDIGGEAFMAVVTMAGATTVVVDSAIAVAADSGLEVSAATAGSAVVADSTVAQVAGFMVAADSAATQVAGFTVAAGSMEAVEVMGVAEATSADTAKLNTG
jgi:hypothetical protein